MTVTENGNLKPITNVYISLKLTHRQSFEYFICRIYGQRDIRVHQRVFNCLNRSLSFITSLCCITDASFSRIKLLSAFWRKQYIQLIS